MSEPQPVGKALTAVDLSTPGDRCGARKKRGEGVCTLPAGWGTDHVGYGRCKLHGGATPNGRKYAVKVEARAAVARFGGELDVHPAQALLTLVRRKAAEVEFWERRCNELDDEALTWSLAASEKGYDGNGPRALRTWEQRKHVAIDLLHTSQRDLAAFSAASLKAGVDSALVDLAKLQAADVLDLLDGVLSRLDLTDTQRAQIPAALADTIGARP